MREMTADECRALHEVADRLVLSGAKASSHALLPVRVPGEPFGLRIETADQKRQRMAVAAQFPEELEAVITVMMSRDTQRPELRVFARRLFDDATRATGTSWRRFGV